MCSSDLVLVSLHQVEYAREYCPRVIALREGRVAYDGATAGLTNALLAEIYGAQTHELFAPLTTVSPVLPELERVAA